MSPSVSKTGPSCFAELGSVEQIIALHISQKPGCPLWQTETSGFSRKPYFPQFDRKLDACCTKLFAIVSSILETCCTVKSLKKAIISKHLSR
jgi:hypothetical protein